MGEQGRDLGDEGVAYAFREGQRVKASHPAVAACPGAFRPLDATDTVVYPADIITASPAG